MKITKVNVEEKLRNQIKSILILVFVLSSIEISYSQKSVNAKSDQFEQTFAIGDFNINHKNLLYQKKSQAVKYPFVLLRPSLEKDVNRLADVSINLKVPVEGVYLIETFAEPADLDLLKEKSDSPLLTVYSTLQLNNERLTKRIMYDTHRGSRQVLGKFELQEGENTIKLWLPAHTRFAELKVKRFSPPVVPNEVAGYSPKVVPPPSRPRLWMNKETLPVIKERLNQEENKIVWDKLVEEVLIPSQFAYDDDQEIFHDESLEKTIEKKAFYYLMTKDTTVGLEAVDLITKYMSVLEFGNVTYGDISREIGRAIYTSAVVYDWCYDLMTSDSRDQLRKRMIQLARDMGIGWPPFYGMESVINGHGNEAQVCRDLLAMSIAIYDEDPEPYKYTSYMVLEQLVPMRKFEYQSPRHNQGIDYGGYRFGWEMHAAWFYYRMLGREVFDDNIKNLPYYWIYMRTPDGKMLRDGDMFNIKYASSDNFNWKNPQTMLLSYAYSKDPLIKGEFYKQGGLSDNPVLFLLLNDPILLPQYNHDELPLTKNFGSVLGGMVARTGWDQTPESGDVVVEIKGGGYNFGNHQHADAGAIQIYFHGIQVGDLGLYLSYGTPYDFNFNKRSISHSMMLAKDPNEPLRFRTTENDGGTRFSQRFPRTPQEVTQDPWFNMGDIRSSYFGPDRQKPAVSYFQADLTAAYSDKMSNYTRGFTFLNLKNDSIPAAVILTDYMEVLNPAFKKYWQINTLNMPSLANGIWKLESQFNDVKGKTYVNMLLPAHSEREVEVLSGESANSVFGVQYHPNSAWPEARGSRIMVSPKRPNKKDRFLTIFQMVNDGFEPLPVKWKEGSGVYTLYVADRIVCLPSGNDYVDQEISIKNDSGSSRMVILNGLKAGFWNVSSVDGTINKNIIIKESENTYSEMLNFEELIVTPKRKYGADKYDF